MKKVRVILSPEAEEVYHFLNKEAPESKNKQSIFDAVNKKIDLIKENVHYRNPVAKNSFLPNMF